MTRVVTIECTVFGCDEELMIYVTDLTRLPTFIKVRCRDHIGLDIHGNPEDGSRAPTQDVLS